MSVVSVKVPDEIKKNMKKRKGRINWSEEIRSFITKKLEEERRRENLERAEKLLEATRSLPRGTAGKLVREDRDSHN
jgi:hypothetical protein